MVIVELSCSAEGAGALAVVGGEVLEEDAELLGEEQVDGEEDEVPHEEAHREHQFGHVVQVAHLGHRRGSDTLTRLWHLHFLPAPTTINQFELS